MYITKITRGNQVTIPKEVREFLKVKEGDYIVFIIEDDKVILRKARITFNS